MATLERAIEIACKAHAGQVDKGGTPYIVHVMRVMSRMTTNEERIVGALHDVLEDCPEMTLAELHEEGFSTGICEAVYAITKQKREPYREYIWRLNQNKLAKAVKMVDLLENQDLNRLGRMPNDNDLERLDKYQAAWAALDNGYSMSLFLKDKRYA